MKERGLIECRIQRQKLECIGVHWRKLAKVGESWRTLLNAKDHAISSLFGEWSNGNESSTSLRALTDPTHEVPASSFVRCERPEGSSSFPGGCKSVRKG